MKKIIMAITAGLLTASVSWATIAFDEAGNYDDVTAPWNAGSNESTGTAFGNWNFTSDGDGTTTFAGNFLGDSTAGTGDINSANGTSFGLFANPAGANSTAFRTLTLGVGEVFSVDLAVNFRNGNKGLSLRDSSNATIFNVNVGSDTYFVDGVDTMWAYDENSIFNVVVENTGTDFAYTVTRGADTTSGTFSGTLDNIEFYNSGTDNGDPQNNLYFNNLDVSVIPEPHSLGLMALGLGLVRLIRRRS